MGIDEFTFYNPKEIALIPMGFCYPGKGKSGDLPTRKECAPLWHESVLSKIRKVHLTILVGQYAQG
jgi:uracil-DNA glycosylase